MLRYVAVYGCDAAAGGAEARRSLDRRLLQLLGKANGGAGWQEVFNSGGLAVHCSGMAERSNTAHLLSGSSGVVLGTVFRRPSAGSGGAACTSVKRLFDEPECARIAASHGEDLLSHYWGDYVAFLQNASGQLRVLHGPMSNVPVYRAVVEGVHLFFSHLRDVMGLLRRLQVRRQFVFGCLLFQSQRQGTGLDEVDELHCGDVWDIQGNDVRRSALWDPRKIAAAEPFEDSRAAEQALRDSVETCTRQWATRFDSMQLRLSGGFDSAVVLGCLRDWRDRPALSCVHTYHVGPGGDERVFARAAASAAGCELIELALPDKLDLGPIQDVLPTPFPRDALVSLSLRSAGGGAEVAQRLRTEAVLNGVDGDNLFGRTASVPGVTDYIRKHGLFSRGLVAVARNAARAERAPTWRTLLTACSHHWRDGAAPYRHSHNRNFHFLSDEVRVARRELERPDEWAQSQPGYRLPPGKAEHTMRICHMRSGIYDPFTDDASVPYPVSPLRSQPVVETALRIPMYVLTEQAGVGVERPLARRAFRAHVPDAILNRQDKGMPAAYAVGLMRDNSQFIRGMLLDGILCRDGYLNRERVQSSLAANPSLLLLYYLGVEAWLRKFSA